MFGPAFAGRNRRAFVWFSGFASNSGCQIQLFVCVLPPSAKRASQPRVQFGASAGVLDAPDGHKSLVNSKPTEGEVPPACWWRPGGGAVVLPVVCYLLRGSCVCSGATTTTPPLIFNI